MVQRSMAQQERSKISSHGAWRRVVFSADCNENGDCPICSTPSEPVDFADCDCPGPTQEEEFEYLEVAGALWARPIGAA